MLSQSRFKQVILLRSDLKMSPGKAAAQASHAAISSSEEARKTHPSWWKEWIESGQCKIVLRVNSEAELLDLERKAKELGLPTALISDMGLTELKPGTITALGIGPAPSSVIDKVTGSLPLY
ncbi:MAG: peptidyl-tRNA hydrolase Pth2 [Candidatus Bathyarchaeota archaeon]|nr:peptidyl-tRNA hydrolase Pth2 [Candidatus Bathyarchaeota archaeon]